MTVEMVAGAQVPAASAPATVAACGAMTLNFSVTAGPAQASGSKPAAGATGAAQVPEGKGLVYVIEDMRHTPLSTTNFRVGVDGKWVGATRNMTYLSFAVDPGVQHLCVDLQGHAWGQLEKGITLRRLNAEAGKTYYLRARMVWGKNTLPLMFVDAVDEDEGQMLLATMLPAVWHPK
jgi:hypothetical protein